MVLKMIFITVLILAITGATWVKDQDNMNPPFKRRIVIDLTVIATLWLLYIIFYMTSSPTTEGIARNVIDVGLLYFVAQLIYLVGKISPMFKDLTDKLKDKGINIPEADEEDEEKGE